MQKNPRQASERQDSYTVISSLGAANRPPEKQAVKCALKNEIRCAWRIIHLFESSLSIIACSFFHVNRTDCMYVLLTVGESSIGYTLVKKENSQWEGWRFAKQIQPDLDCGKTCIMGNGYPAS
ncbi:MAG: hypothetical protein IJ381_05490, partial [Clostridia bacterium]|nr:hypothetical protein [Clostridia bacterium]